MKLTESQMHILKHALGITQGRKPYRKHFVTGEGSKDYSDCMWLAYMGFMTRHPGTELSGGDDVFLVTAKGRMLATGESYPKNHEGKCPDCGSNPHTDDCKWKYSNLVARVKELEAENVNMLLSYNAAINYALEDDDFDFLRVWMEGNFDALRGEWDDAPDDIYLAEATSYG